MSAYTFGNIPDDAAQPALFADLGPADVRPAKQGRSYSGGQPAMLCAWCFASVGPFIRSTDGISYCVSCSRAIAHDGHGPLLDR